MTDTLIAPSRCTRVRRAPQARHQSTGPTSPAAAPIEADADGPEPASLSTRALFALLGLFFTGWATSALAGNETIYNSWAKLGISPLLATTIGCLELAAGLGLLAGLRWLRIGFASAVGLVVLMCGAVAYHVRAGDGFAAHGAVVMLIASSFAATGAFTAIRRQLLNSTAISRIDSALAVLTFARPLPLRLLRSRP